MSPTEIITFSILLLSLIFTVVFWGVVISNGLDENTRALEALRESRVYSSSSARNLASKLLDTYPMWTTTTNLPEDAIVLSPGDEASKAKMEELISLLPPGADHAILFKEGCNMLQNVLIAAQRMTGGELYIGYEVNGVTYKLVFNSPFVKKGASKSEA